MQKTVLSSAIAQIICLVIGLLEHVSLVFVTLAGKGYPVTKVSNSLILCLNIILTAKHEFLAPKISLFPKAVNGILGLLVLNSKPAQFCVKSVMFPIPITLS